MEIRTFICEPYVDPVTFGITYRIILYHNDIVLYYGCHNRSAEQKKFGKIDFINMILEAYDINPLTEEEVVLHKLQRNINEHNST